MPIRLLPPDVAAKIAAGEVIERPVSVVKELIENSLDANALHINIELRDGGLKTIKVLDDGSGIPPEEVGLAFRRFATSKMTHVDDLTAIGTLGFRGEALASIAAVSDMAIITRTSDVNFATEMEVSGGSVLRSSTIGAQVGTSVTVRDLFDNFPARRKFLSSSPAETSRVRILIQRYALAYPEVAFELQVDGRRSVATYGSKSLVDALAQIYDTSLAGAMLTVDGGDPASVLVSGMVGAPIISRSTRAHVNVFVNGRWVQAGRLGHAVEQAYRGFLGERRFPVVVLNLRITPSEVDVNVHPAKAEVRFRNANGVYGAVQRAVREALLRDSPVPHVKSIGGSQSGEIRTGAMWISNLAPNQKPSGHAAQAAAVGESTEPVVPKDVLPALRVLGQSHSTYIIAEGPDGLYLVDQHAAHERVLYERFISQAESSNSQILMEPTHIDLSEISPVVSEAFVDAQETLQENGFLIEPFGPSSYRLLGVPAEMGVEDPVAGLLDVVRGFTVADLSDRHERVARSIACHGAIRAGKKLAQKEMEEITRLLEACSQPHTCPHGRPTIIHISRVRLEREFGRT